MVRSSPWEDDAIAMDLDSVEGLAPVPLACGGGGRVPGLPLLVGRDRVLLAG